MEQRDVIRGGGLEAVPHFPPPRGAERPLRLLPSSRRRAPHPQPPRSAQPAAAPPGRLMPASPALSGLAAARPPPRAARSPPRAVGRRDRAGLGSRPGAVEQQGSGGVRPPRGSPAPFRFPVTGFLRTGLCRAGRPGSSSHSAPPGSRTQGPAAPRSADGSLARPGALRRGRRPPAPKRAAVCPAAPPRGCWCAGGARRLTPGAEPCRRPKFLPRAGPRLPLGVEARQSLLCARRPGGAVRGDCAETAAGAARAALRSRRPSR